MTELHGDFNCLDKDKKSKDDIWIPLFLTCLAFVGNGQAPNIALEKEVAYLRGKVDALCENK